MLVHEFLETSASTAPDKVALVAGGERLTYAEIDARANRLAQALLAHGIQRGDRVVIQLPNSTQAVVAIFGALKAGAVFVPVNPTAKRDKLAYILNNCRASALVSGLHPDFLPDSRWLKVATGCANEGPNEPEPGTSGPPAARSPAPVSEENPNGFSIFEAAVGRDVPRSVLTYEEIQGEFLAEKPPNSNLDTDLACLIYTSGSTGRPKGVMCEHRNVVFASGSIIQYLENRPSDIVLGLLPLSFDYGLYQLLMTFRFGGTLVLENSFAFPALVLQRIVQERVTGLPGVPTVFTLLLQMDLEDYDLSSLRYLTNTAAALPATHILKLRDRFPQARLYSMYGLTETKRTLYLPPEELDQRPGSVGVPIPGTEAWLEDVEGRRSGPGQVGELVVRGPHVMRGYWEDEKATTLRFRPGPIPGERLCYTGDLFRQDADGYFYFVGRKDEIIKSRGEKVAPKEVEETLYALEGVAEAAVIGVPDPVLGEAVKAFVVPKSQSLTASCVLAHCRARLEDFMVPRVVEFVTVLPKNASGKVDKIALRSKARVTLAAGPQTFEIAPAT
jgi:amino acid adenylation domain-containing protein